MSEQKFDDFVRSGWQFDDWVVSEKKFDDCGEWVEV